MSEKKEQNERKQTLKKIDQRSNHEIREGGDGWDTLTRMKAYVLTLPKWDYFKLI